MTRKFEYQVIFIQDELYTSQTNKVKNMYNNLTNWSKLCFDINVQSCSPYLNANLRWTIFCKETRVYGRFRNRREHSSTRFYIKYYLKSEITFI